MVSGVIPFSLDFALELAAGLEPEEAICARYKVEPAGLLFLLETPSFIQVLSRLKVDLAREGALIEIKAKLALERLRAEAESMAGDVNLDAKDKLAAMEFVRKCAAGPRKERKISPFRFRIVRADGETVAELKLSADYSEALMEADGGGGEEIEA
jgi:hypothetical protein